MHVLIALLTFLIAGMFVLHPAGIIHAEDSIMNIAEAKKGAGTPLSRHSPPGSATEQSETGSGFQNGVFVVTGVPKIFDQGRDAKSYLQDVIRKATTSTSKGSVGWGEDTPNAVINFTMSDGGNESSERLPLGGGVQVGEKLWLFAAYARDSAYAQDVEMNEPIQVQGDDSVALILRGIHGWNVHLRPSTDQSGTSSPLNEATNGLLDNLTASYQPSFGTGMGGGRITGGRIPIQVGESQQSTELVFGYTDVGESPIEVQWNAQDGTSGTHEPSATGGSGSVVNFDPESFADNCNPNKLRKVFTSPDWPPGATSMKWAVYINGVYDSEQSTGTKNAVRRAKVSVDPNPNGKRVGPGCRVRVVWGFLYPGDEIDEFETPSSGSGSPVPSEPSSPGQGQTAQGQEETTEDEQPHDPNESTDEPPDSQTSTPTLTQSGQEAGEGEPCDPSPIVRTGDMQFIALVCTYNPPRPCPDDAAVGECGKCLEWGTEVTDFLQGDHAILVGVILPDGETIRWSRQIGEAGKREYEDDGDGGEGPLSSVTYPNGVKIRLGGSNGHYYHVEAPRSVVAQTTAGETSTSSTTQQAEAGKAKSPPIPVVKLNNKEELKHQFFVNEDKTFKLYIKNDINMTDEQNALLDKAKLKGKCFPPFVAFPAMMVDIKVKTSETFFKGIPSLTFSLGPGEAYTAEGTLDPYLPDIKNYEEDVLFGAKIEIKIWREGGSPENSLFDKSFNVYRFLDVADDDHTKDVEFAKTLGDGKDHAVRVRPVKILVHEEAAVKFEKPLNQEFTVKKRDTNTPEFLFDPAKKGKSSVSEGSVTILAKADNTFVGKLVVRGTGVPKNKILFQENLFKAKLKEIARLAKQNEMAKASPPNYLVHPALVTPGEVTHIERPSLVTAVKNRIEALFGPLWKGLEWTSSPDGNNTVTLEWMLRENNHKPSPFALGVTTTDSWDEIQEIIARKDEWNKAELAFRLAQVINPSLIEDVSLWPDSILESHFGFGDNKTTLTYDQIVNGIAKTAAHEVSHTLGLQHPIQVGTRTTPTYETQILVLNPATDPITEFSLKFHGVSTGVIPFDFTGWSFLPIWKALTAVRTIGVENYGANDWGVEVRRCKSYLAAFTLKDEIPPAKVATFCGKATEPADQLRIFILEFVNHLQWYNSPLLELVPSSVGTIHGMLDGVTARPIKEKIYSTHQLALVELPDVLQKTIEKDIMYGGYNDVDGKLSFQSGVSLEPLKMALGLKYTKEDVDKVVKLFKAQGEAFESWKPGDENFRDTEKKPTTKK